MHYTIALLEDLAQETSFQFNAAGNKYLIYMIKESENATISVKYDTHAEAFKVFMKLTEAVLTGCYSFDQRISIMSGGIV